MKAEVRRCKMKKKKKTFSSDLAAAEPTRVARFFSVQQTKMGGNTPKWPHAYQMALKNIKCP
jgi:hypothetical protein